MIWLLVFPINRVYSCQIRDVFLGLICLGKSQPVYFLSHPSHTHSHHSLPRPPSPTQELLRLPRQAGYPRPDRLPAGETPTRWSVAVGRDCGNRGVFPRRPRLPWLPSPHAEQRNALWLARALLCVCELWHSPLREASPEFLEVKLGLLSV
jgi:hypothetical protein